MIEQIYLAGPDVFLPNATEVGRRKVELCRRYGFKGLFPLDIGMKAPPTKQGASAIYMANLDLMRRADAVVANVTPFRGASADVGTAFELGFFAAAGKPAFAYSSDTRNLIERSRVIMGLDEYAANDGDGFVIEDFELPDNLMLPSAVTASGGQWIVHSSLRKAKLCAFEAFEDCLRAIKADTCLQSTLSAARG